MIFSAVPGNSQKLDGGAMFGHTPKALWQKWAELDERNRIDLQCRAMLLETGNTNILFETGIGCFLEPKLSDRFGAQTPHIHQLVENLKDLDVSPEQINWVVLSHLHFDHAGGLLPSYSEIQDGNDGLLFPNARYIVSRDAFARAEQPHSRDKASFIPGLTEKLQRTGRLFLVDEGSRCPVLPEYIELLFTHGHTPGHMHTLIHGSKRNLFFAGDLIPGLSWVRLPIVMGYDRFPEKTVEEKKQVYERALKEQWLIFYTHDPHIGCSEIEKDGKKRWNPTGPVAHPERIEL